MADIETVDNKTTSAAENSDATVMGKTEGAVNQVSATEQLLQSANIDLNADGESEQVEAVQISAGAAEPGSGGEAEGRLKIRSGGSEIQMTFREKNAVMSGILTGMQFEDLDGDGAKDVFIIIPGNGASFSYSNYFIYSYKKNIKYSFVSDNILTDFINSFGFKYTGDNKLSIINSKLNFSAVLTIESYNVQETTKEYMKDYEQRAWIEPVSVDISEGSRLALTTGVNGRPEIKVPLPVFGLATVDMIGEIDLYYYIDSSFNPVLKRFVVLDFKDGDKIKAGSYEVDNF